jgi:hypothetical protein
MRFSEAERLAGRNMCFNRPYEASQIIEARKIVNPVSKPKTSEQSQKPEPTKEASPKPPAQPLFGSAYSGRGRQRSFGRSRMGCW